MANDILNHPNFVKKNLCNSFSDRTVQRFYKFNTSIMVSHSDASWLDEQYQSDTRPLAERFEYLTVQHCHLVASDDVAVMTPE